MAEKLLNRPVLVLVVFALFSAIGVAVVGRISIDAFPNIEEPIVMISTSYANAGPESVEEAVTKPIEESLVSLNNLKKITSVSMEGYSEVTLDLNQGTDIDSAVNEIRDKLEEAKEAFPSGVKNPSILRMSMSDLSVLSLAVRGDKSENELAKIATDFIKPRLLQSNGVARASVYGGQTKIIRVELSQNRLEAYGLTLSQVADSLALLNLDLGGGKITERKKNYIIRTTGNFRSIEEVNDSIVANAGGFDVRLSDIGEASEGYFDEDSAVFINGEAGVSVEVQKQSGKNTVNVADALYEKIAELNRSLPDGIEIEVISDNSVEIRSTMQALVKSAWQGLLLAVLILFVFLKSLKSTVIIAISIPLSILVTLLVMALCHVTLNMMTMAGLILGIGMIVDAPIVVLENIVTYRSRGLDAKRAAIKGTDEMVLSVLAGNLTTIFVFIPFLLYKERLGVMALLFEGVIITVVITIITSLFVALLLVPVLAGHFLPITNRSERPVRTQFFIGLYGLFDAGFNAILRVYKKILLCAMCHKKTTLAIATTVLLATAGLVPFLNITMMAESSSRIVTLNVTLPVGTPFQTTREEMLKWQEIAMDEIRGYRNVIVSIGVSNDSFNLSSNKGSLDIFLEDERQGGDTAASVKRKLQSHFGEFIGASFSFGSDLDDAVSGSDIDIAVRGTSLVQTNAVARRICEVVQNTPGLSQPVSDMAEGLPQIEVVIDRDRAASFGVTVADIANEISNCVNGVKATTYRADGKDLAMYVRYELADRGESIDLDSIFVRGRETLVCVANLARIKKGVGPVTIRRENQIRTIHIKADIQDGRRADAVEKTLAERISRGVKIPDGVYISFEGSWQKIIGQLKTFGVIIALAILLVFGVMAGTYESFKAPLINLMTIPFLLIGVVLIYFLTGQPFSIISAIGIVMLVGMVVNNGIVLVDATNLMVRGGMELDEACIRSGASRLRPVLMTTLTTVLGTIPMALDSSGNSAIIQPIGIGIVGGLLSSTFVTLVVIPVVYSLVMRRRGCGEAECSIGQET